MKTIVQRDPVKGRGVYAKELIHAGEVIEICELLLMDHSEVQNSLESYVYEYSVKKAAVALGNGSLFNHCDRSNSEFYFNYKKNIFVSRPGK